MPRVRIAGCAMNGIVARDERRPRARSTSLRSTRAVPGHRRQSARGRRSRVMCESSSRAFRSTSTAGVASRKFIAGMRLCPPASGFASVPCSASSRQRLVERRRTEILERRRLHAVAAPVSQPRLQLPLAAPRAPASSSSCRPTRAAAGRPRRSCRRPARSRCTSSSCAARRLRSARSTPCRACNRRAPLPSICIVKRSGATLSVSATVTSNFAAVTGPTLTFITPS